eukprot:6098-Heterococcus_DN1.PRE.1
MCTYAVVSLNVSVASGHVKSSKHVCQCTANRDTWCGYPVHHKCRSIQLSEHENNEKLTVHNSNGHG